MLSAERIQWAVLGLAVLIYMQLSYTLGPSALLGLSVMGVLQWAFAWRYASRLGAYRSATVLEPGAVMAVSLLGFMPALAFANPLGLVFAAAGLGLLITLGIWSMIRYPARGDRQPELPIWSDVRFGLYGGLLFAAFCSVIEILGFLIAALVGATSERGDPSLLKVLAAYLLAGTLGGGLVGLLRPLLRWPLGAMFLGIFAGLPVYGSIGVAFGAVPMSADHWGLTLFAAVSVGPALALGLRMAGEVPLGNLPIRSLL